MAEGGYSMSPFNHQLMHGFKYEEDEDNKMCALVTDNNERVNVNVMPTGNEYEVENGPYLEQGGWPQNR